MTVHRLTPTQYGTPAQRTVNRLTFYTGLQGNDGRPEDRLTGLSDPKVFSVRPVFWPAEIRGLSCTTNYFIQIFFVLKYYKRQAMHFEQANEASVALVGHQLH